MLEDERTYLKSCVNSIIKEGLRQTSNNTWYITTKELARVSHIEEAWLRENLDVIEELFLESNDVFEVEMVESDFDVTFYRELVCQACPDYYKRCYNNCSNCDTWCDSMAEANDTLSETLKDVKDRVEHIVFGIIDDLKDDADVRNDCFKDDVLKRLEELENELTDTICQYIKNGSSLDWCEDVARLAQDIDPYEFADNYSQINGYKELAEEIRDSILKGDTKVTDKLNEWAKDEDDKNLRYRASLLLKKSKELAL